jgi:thiamine-monophosphate kinase
MAQLLSDLGERRIISELLAPRYAHETRFGDDCASVALGSGEGQVLIATTDPCPPPMATALGFDDLYYTGWLLATLNLSDLAAAGAAPVGLLTSLNLPADTPVARFKRLLDGIDACCEAAGTHVIGGNLKEAPQFDVSATALGICEADEQLHRNGAQAGDAVVVIGELGDFWAGVLGYRDGLIETGDAEHPLMRNVLTPLPKIAVMRELAAAKLLTASMDNSDGLYPSLVQLASDNSLGVDVEADTIVFSPPVAAMADSLGVHPMRMALGWGDWQIVATARPDDVGAVTATAASSGIAVRQIGLLSPGDGVTLTVAGRHGRMMPLDSERFVIDSWFSSGLDGYIERLETAPLVAQAPGRERA